VRRGEEEVGTKSGIGKGGWSWERSCGRCGGWDGGRAVILVTCQGGGGGGKERGRGWGWVEGVQGVGVAYVRDGRGEESWSGAKGAERVVGGGVKR